MRAGERERHGRGGCYQEAGDRDQAGAEPSDELADHKAGGQRADALGDEQQPGVQHGLAVQLLVVQRQQEHAGIDRRAGGEQDRGGAPERTQPQQPHVHDRMPAARPRGPGNEGAEQRDPGQQRDEHAGMADPAVLGEVRQTEQDSGERRRQQDEPGHVQARPPGPGTRAVTGQQPPGEHQPSRDHRHVDQEQPAPAQPVEDQSADHRAEDRPER